MRRIVSPDQKKPRYTQARIGMGSAVTKLRHYQDNGDFRQAMITTAKKAALSACQHCGDATPEGVAFCCAGCESVHAILVRNGLEHFYDLQEKSLRPRGRKPLLPLSSDAGESEIPEHELTQRFYLEGIHCLGCLWLLEKLPEIEPGIKTSTLDFTHAILTITRSKETSWSQVVDWVRKLGYLPKAIASNHEMESKMRSDRNRQAIRLGVAGFCAGNIMLLTVSLYGGATGTLAENFQLLSFLLALPALTFSAWPLYRSALAPLRRGIISVDLAVALAIWVGIGWSVFNLAFGAASETYFDSLTMLVFLLLSSRYFLNRYRESLSKETPSLSLLSRVRFLRRGGKSGEARAEELKEGDEFLLRSGQTLPVDSVLASPQAHFDLSLLTGESEPVKLLQGDSIDSGARLLTNSALLTTKRIAATSRLAKILEQIRSEQLSKSPSLDFANRIGTRFVIVVLGLAALVTLLFPFPSGLQRALVLVIVTCPCVLAFAVPLAFTRALQLAAQAGILFRSAEKLEELASAKVVFLDKTGTLTTGNFEVLRWEQKCGSEQATRNAVLALESRSSHPVAKALLRHLSPGASPTEIPETFSEIHGTGVAGRIGSSLWEVVRITSSDRFHNHVGVFCDGKVQAEITLGDSIRPEAKRVLEELRSLGLEPVILSGDGKPRVAEVAAELGVPNWHGGLSPEQKAEIARGTPNSLMVGDGANDSVAFQAARVGIAMRGAMDLSLKHSDVVLASPGLDGVVKAIRSSRSTMSLVRLCFLVTLAYNILAGCLAVGGVMQPLWAAVIMPVSALSVFTLIQWKSRERAP